jgi:chromosome segregation ATPase
MAFKIFHIGKANTEIERLEAELKTANEKIAALSENPTAVEKDAEGLRTELTKVTGEKSALEIQVMALQSSHKILTAERDAAKAELAKAPAEIEKKAAALAIKQVSSQGIPPLPITAIEGITGQKPGAMTFDEKLAVAANARKAASPPT